MDRKKRKSVFCNIKSTDVEHQTSQSSPWVNDIRASFNKMKRPHHRWFIFTQEKLTLEMVIMEKKSPGEKSSNTNMAAKAYRNNHFFFKFYEWLNWVPPVNAYSKEDRARFSSSIGVAYKQDISLLASPDLCVTVIINILIKRGKMNAYSRIYCWVRDCEKWLYTENPRGNGANRNHAPRLELIDWLYSYSKLISSPRFQRMIIRLGLKCTNNLTTELIFVSGTVTQEASN